jgi:2-methylisocitrate lyase-like PEP mutase family enzyme
MENKSAELKRLMNTERPLVVPDAYDMLSARVIQTAGFGAVQCSGYSFSINHLYKNEQALPLEENLEYLKRDGGFSRMLKEDGVLTDMKYLSYLLEK